LNWEWSTDLQAQLDQLSAGQRRAILLIVMAESKGEPITRLLKTPYSCRWCGRVIGHSADGKAARKEALTAHEAGCERQGRPWQFATSLVTFYTRWKAADSSFVECLNLARREVRENALQRAAWILQMGAPEAAIELRRQVAEAKDESDRRLASVAILDRADVKTADKSSGTPVDMAFKRALEYAYGSSNDDDNNPPA
jgi:hypothetical protein